jgi:hypothetical protein
MKKWNIIGIFTLLVTGMVLMSGCVSPVSPGTVPTATPTPKIGNLIVLQTPSSTPAVAVPAARYVVGDIVWRNDSNYNNETHSSRGMLVIQVDAQSYHYQYVSKDDGDQLWSQIFPNLETNTTAAFEASYPRKVDHVSTILSQYESMIEFDTAMAKKYGADYC